jgi:hypothetical protein
MIFRKWKQAPSDERDKQKNDELEEAEARANTLVDKAVQLQTLVMRRDQENHWQQAVNNLFSGGKA